MTDTASSVAAQIDVRPIKSLAVSLLPVDSLLRRVLCSEPDKMPPTDFLAKLGTWLVLLREEEAL
jgi:hypothetical protein